MDDWERVLYTTLGVVFASLAPLAVRVFRSLASLAALAVKLWPDPQSRRLITHRV